MIPVIFLTPKPCALRGDDEAAKAQAIKDGNTGRAAVGFAGALRLRTAVSSFPRAMAVRRQPAQPPCRAVDVCAFLPCASSSPGGTTRKNAEMPC